MCDRKQSIIFLVASSIRLSPRTTKLHVLFELCISCWLLKSNLLKYHHEYLKTLFMAVLLIIITLGFSGQPPLGHVLYILDAAISKLTAPCAVYAKSNIPGTCYRYQHNEFLCPVAWVASQLINLASPGNRCSWWTFDWLGTPSDTVVLTIRRPMSLSLRTYHPLISELCLE